MSEWQIRKIGSLGRIVTGKTPPTVEPDNFNGEYPFITIPDLDGRVFIEKTSRTLSSKGGSAVHTSLLPAGAVMMSCIATVGRCGITVRPSFTNQQINSLIPNSEADSRYLYYVFTQLGAKLEEAGGGGSIYTNVSKSRFADIDIAIPSDVSEQRAIAHILGTLDDKIELNRRQSETLQEMARALFKAWFVDFEPVRAKMSGRWQRGQTLPGLPAHLWDIFPNRLVETEHGEVPQGWEITTAGQIYDIGIGKTPPRKESEWFSESSDDVPWMSIKDLGRAEVFISDVSEYLTREAVEKFRIRRIPDGTVVLSFKLTVGRVAITDGEMLSNEAIAHFLPKTGNCLGTSYLYCYLRNFNYESLGSTSSIATAVNSNSVRAMPITVPCVTICKAFESLTASSFAQIRTILRESHTLAALRDTLLPKLISGELRIQNLGKFFKKENP